MKLAILCHMHHPIREPYEGGTEAHTAMLAAGLVARGHDVTLFAKEGSVSTAVIHPLVPADFTFMRIASPLVRTQQRGFLAEAVQHSIDIIRASDFDAVVNNSLSALPYVFLQDVAMMTVLHTPPTLADVNAVLEHPDWAPGARHAWVTVSHANADAWRPLLPAVHTVYNGIRLSEWAPRVPSVPGLAVWAARITPEKGLHLAIDAAVRADMDFEFAGPISHSDYWADEIEPRLSSRVRYRGHLTHDDLRHFIASGCVFVASPLWAEPFGLSVVEALASGTPVAAFASGALPELITPENGALAAPGDDASLAIAMRRAASRDRRATRRTAERFDADEMIRQYESLIVGLVDRGTLSEGWPVPLVHSQGGSS